MNGSGNTRLYFSLLDPQVESNKTLTVRVKGHRQWRPVSLSVVVGKQECNYLASTLAAGAVRQCQDIKMSGSSNTGGWGLCWLHTNNSFSVSLDALRLHANIILYVFQGILVTEHQWQWWKKYSYHLLK